MHSLCEASRRVVPFAHSCRFCWLRDRGARMTERRCPASSAVWSANGADRRLSILDVPAAEALEGFAIRSDDIRIDRFGSGHEPGIVLAQAPRRAAL
jgi:hypothetical protein